MRLWYRRFDSAAAHSERAIQVDDSERGLGAAAGHPLRNGELFIFANHRLAEGSYQTRMWRSRTGSARRRRR